MTSEKVRYHAGADAVLRRQYPTKKCYAKFDKFSRGHKRSVDTEAERKAAEKRARKARRLESMGVNSNG